jgi:hypothetical protein
MLAFFHLLVTFVANLFRSRRQLEVENLFLRHQLNIAMRRAPHRLRLRTSERALLVLMTWLWPSLLGLSRVVQPDTILRWHRAGFRVYWRWKSRGRPGRPSVSRELRELIRRMSRENLLWGAPRIHGELLKLGFEIAESTVSKYMARRSAWRTSAYSSYYNETRTHLGLARDTPIPRAVQRSGTIVTTPILSGLHHRYARI